MFNGGRRTYLPLYIIQRRYIMYYIYILHLTPVDTENRDYQTIIFMTIE